MPDSQKSGIQPDLLKIAGLGMLIVLVLKLHFAAVLDLYSDEIFYWLASTHPALAYSDLPFVTAQLAGLGNSLAPGNPIAVRLLFLILGSCIPLFVFWVARAAVPRQQAFEAAALSLCIPLAGFLGLLAVPDVPLISCGLLASGFFMRALQDNTWKHWLATGILVGLGLSTHYRFALYPAAVFFFLLSFPGARSCWSNPRFWCAVAIAAVGLTPILWFNLNQELASASFYLVERHPWEFQATGLLHVFKQAGLVTPPLYALLLYTLWFLWQKAKRGDRNAALLFSISLTNLLVYLVLAPWTDANSTSIHWPLSGYFPLLVYTPQATRNLIAGLTGRYSSRQLRRAMKTTISLGFIGTVVAITGVGSQAYQGSLQKIIGPGILSNKMAGWKEFGDFTSRLLEQEYAAEPPVIITDNYYTAAQLMFAGISNEVFTPDRDKAVRDGRMRQLQLWQMDVTALQQERFRNRSILFISEDSTLEVEDKQTLMLEMCEMASSLRALDQLMLFNGDKQFSFYRGYGLFDNDTQRATPCPLPMRAWIDRPAGDTPVRGQVDVAGWAYSEEIGVDSVHLLVNGEAVMMLHYGIPRPDVAEVMNVTSDPNLPNLGYGGMWDSTSVSNGHYRLALEIRNKQGSILRYGERVVQVSN